MNAREVKSVVNIPVIVAGGIRSAASAEQILQEGSADFIALGRSLISNPDFCRKVTLGRYDDIRECLSCQDCLNALYSGRSLRCAINPEAGRECEFRGISRSEKFKTVAVVGAGPAGMEAARVAAMRGHRVVIVDKDARLGGALKAGCIPPNKEKVRSLINWYEKQLRNLGVEVRLGCHWSISIAQEIRPDVLIMATGAEYTRLMPGSEIALSASEALLFPDKIGKDVVIIGGGATGSETAEFIAGERVTLAIERMKDFSGELVFQQKVEDPGNRTKITIVEMLDEICSDMDGQNAKIIKLKLKGCGINVITSTKVNAIGDDVMQVEQIATGNKSEISFDTVILAGGPQPSSLSAEIPTGCEVHTVGDCNSVGRIMNAIHDGYCIAREI